MELLCGPKLICRLQEDFYLTKFAASTDDENLKKLQENQILVGVLNPFLNNEKLKELTSKNIKCFALEMLLAPIKRGYKVITLASTWKSRSEGSSSITLLSYISYLRVLFKYL